MMNRAPFLLVLITICVATPAWAQDPPDTDIYIAELRLSPGSAEMGPPTNATQRTGYDNQPWFTPDGSGFWYARWDGVETDVYLYDLAAGTSAQVTRTPWGEYSPSPADADGGIFAVGGGGDPLQMGLWRYSASGEPVEPLVIRTVGYYGIFDEELLFAWLNDGAGTLIHVDRRDGTVTPFREGVAPGPPRRIPGEAAMSFLEANMTGQMTVMRLEPRTLEITPIMPAVGDGRDFVWTPDGRILMGEGNAIFIRDPNGDNTWTEVARVPELDEITRLAVSADGERIALVATSR